MWSSSFKDDVRSDANHQRGWDAFRGKWKPWIRLPPTDRLWFPLWATNGFNARREGQIAGYTTGDPGNTRAKPRQATGSDPRAGLSTKAAQHGFAAGIYIIKYYCVPFFYFYCCYSHNKKPLVSCEVAHASAWTHVHIISEAFLGCSADGHLAYEKRDFTSCVTLNLFS